MRQGISRQGSIMMIAGLIALGGAMVADLSRKAAAQDGLAMDTALVITGIDSPFSYRIYHILKHAYQEIGVKTRFEALPTLGGIAAVNRGKFDGDIARIANIERHFSNLVQVPGPVARMALAVITRQDTPLDRAALQQAGRDGFAYQRNLLLLRQRFDGGRSFELRDAKTLLTMVDAGRARAGIAVYPFIARVIDAFPSLQVREDLLDMVPLYHYLHERHRHLIPLLEPILEGQVTRHGGLVDIRKPTTD